jgi:hypothetical protein
MKYSGRSNRRSYPAFPLLPSSPGPFRRSEIKQSRKETETMKTHASPRSASSTSWIPVHAAFGLVGLIWALTGWSNSLAQAPSAPTNLQWSLAQTGEATPNTSAQLSYKIIERPDHRYGYDIVANGNVIIHQTSVPAVPGNQGFETEDGATKVALLVIEKIREGEMPPTVSSQEMKQLKAIK